MLPLSLSDWPTGTFNSKLFLVLFNTAVMYSSILASATNFKPCFKRSEPWIFSLSSIILSHFTAQTYFYICNQGLNPTHKAKRCHFHPILIFATQQPTQVESQFRRM